MYVKIYVTTNGRIYQIIIKKGEVFIKNFIYHEMHLENQ